MRLSQWRPSFLAFINQYLDFEGGFGLSMPTTVGAFVGHVPPLFNTEYSPIPPDTAVGKAEQWFFLLARFPYDIPYKDLPIGALEGLHASMCLRLLWNWSRIRDTTGRQGYDPYKPLLSGLAVIESDYPVKVSEDSYENRDWLIQLTWKTVITFEAEPEEPIDPILLTHLDIDVYRSTLRDISIATLDKRITHLYSPT